MIRPDVIVPVGECRCVGTPHEDGDTVTMWPVCTISVGAAAHIAVSMYAQDPLALQVGLSRAFVEYGIKAWSFVDEKGNPIPVDSKDPEWSSLVERLLPFTEGGNAVAEVGDSLYATDALAPLRLRPAKSSPDGQTTPSTSATRPIGPKARPRSRRSSPATSVVGRRSAAQGR